MTLTRSVTKQIEFTEVMKQFKKYVSKSDTRPVLKYVYFDSSDYLVATDSHKLLRVHSDYISNIPEGVEIGSLINPKTLEVKSEEFEFKYPATNRLIPDYTNIDIELNRDNIKELQGGLKQLRPIYKEIKNKVVKMEIGSDKTILSSEYKKMIIFSDKTKNKVETIREQVTINNFYSDSEDFTIYFNGDYLNNALITVKKLDKLTVDKTIIGFIGGLRPFVIRQKGVFDILLMPVRVF